MLSEGAIGRCAIENVLPEVLCYRQRTFATGDLMSAIGLCRSATGGSTVALTCYRMNEGDSMCYRSVMLPESATGECYRTVLPESATGECYRSSR